MGEVLKTKVPISLLTEEGLSYVASGVGKPLYADQATEEMGMINFYRVCIEIETEAACPQVLEVFTDDKNFVEVEVEYQNKPQSCSICKIFGHNMYKCPKSNLQWVSRGKNPRGRTL